MKRGISFIVIVLAFALILLPSVFAVEITLVRDNYYGKETLQAEITGNFVSLDVSNVLVYEDNATGAEATLSGLVKRGKKYHYYAVLPDKAGNFSLRVENVQYIQSGKLIDDANSASFWILESNGTILSVNPGFVIVNDDDFSINLMSYNGNQEVTATFAGSGESQSIDLIDSLREDVRFSTIGVQSGESSLNVGAYNISIFLLTGYEGEIEEIGNLRIIPVNLIGNLNRNEDYTFELVLENTGKENITGLNISSDLKVLIEPDGIDFLETGKKEVVKITILKVGDAESVSGKIFVNFGDELSVLPISFVIDEENEVVVDIDVEDDSDVEDSIDSLSCYDLGGEICLNNLKCDEEDEPSLDGPCCLGECIEESGFNWWLIGLLILVLGGGIAGFFYMRMKKKQIPKSNKEVLNDKSDIFKRRMNLRRGPEVNKELDRV